MGLGLLLTLTTFLVAQPASEIVWKIAIDNESGRTLVRAFSLNDEKTDIFYAYDPVSNDLMDFNEVDLKKEWIVSEPGTEIWWPHPEFKRDLKRRSRVEDFFQEAMDGLDGTKSIDELIQKTTAEVEKTRAELLHLLDYKALKPFKNYLIDRDVIEPFKTEYAHDESRFDAFVLLTLKTAKAEKNSLRAALLDLSEKPFYPLSWMVESKRKYSLNVRLTALALLTHNHVAEVLLVQAYSLLEGRNSAFEIARLINFAYKNERDFWIQHSENRKIDNKMKVDNDSDLDFLNARKKWKVNIALKTRVLEPLFRFKSINQKNLEVWVPYFQLYHFYGAFLLASRLISEKQMKRDLVTATTVSAGLSYKLKTLGLDRDQLSRIQKFYSEGAEQAWALKDLIELPVK